MPINESGMQEQGYQLKELHLFYLLDTSGSMQGEGIAQLNSGMGETFRILREKFQNSNDVHLRVSVMTFANSAQWVTGTPASRYSEYIEDFNDFPEQNAAGLTHLGEALRLLEKGLSRNTMLESPTGNKRPIIIIMSDGEPNDDWMSALESIKKNRWYQQSIKIAIALGPQANHSVLEKVVGGNEAVLTVTDMRQFAEMMVAVSVTSTLAGSVSRVDYSNEWKRDSHEVSDIISDVRKQVDGDSIPVHDYVGNHPSKMTPPPPMSEDDPFRDIDIE